MASLLDGLRTRLALRSLPVTDAPAAAAFRAFDATRDLRGKGFRSLCYAPFVQMSFAPNGNVSACCMGRDVVLGNVTRDRLEDIWNGERMLDFRASLQRYEFPTGCGSCKWSFDAGNYLDHPIRDFDALPTPTPQPQWPLRLELALSNTCNFACVMCNGSLSSVIRAKEGLPALPRLYGDQFFEDLGPYLDHAQELALVGGEPFLMHECHRVWDMLIERGLSPTCNITTNGSQYNQRVERILHNLPVNLTLSVDGMTKATMESVRINSHYETFMENIQRFNEYAQGSSDLHPRKRLHQLLLNYCVMRPNWHELPKFFRFAESLKAKASPIIVIHPASFSLASLPKDECRAIVAKLESQTDSLARELGPQNRTAWLEMITELRNHVQEDPAAITHILEDRRRLNPLGEAWALFQEGELNAALEVAQDIPDSHPYYYGVLAMMANIRTALGDYAGAEQLAEAATRRFPRRPEGRIALARVHYHQGRFEEGLALLDAADEALRTMSRSVDAVSDRILREQATLLGASLQAAAGRTDEALARIDGLLAQAPEHAEGLKLREQILATAAVMPAVNVGPDRLGDR